VEDNVAMQNNNYYDKSVSRYDNSVKDFLAYQAAFGTVIIPSVPTVGTPYAADIHYVVVPYPGGSIPLSGGPVANLGPLVAERVRHHDPLGLRPRPGPTTRCRKPGNRARSATSATPRPCTSTATPSSARPTRTTRT
jgi:hypothetical protein